MENEHSPFSALEAATEILGGKSALARICGVSATAAWKWLQSSKRLPAEYVLRVEAATGVSRHLLRPDIYPIDLPPLSPAQIGEETPLCGPILLARRMAGQGNRHANLDKGATA